MNKKEAIFLLNKNGYKTTKRRKDILDFFANADGYRTAKELNDFMESRYEGISFDTVYRNLHLYHELGILEGTELKGEKHFRMKCGDHHHHHFICNDCGKTKKLDICPMDEVEALLKNFQVIGHKFEVYGLCPVCQNAS
ncbi:Fur family transcriptional regulator [Virgibacillus sp. W0430]|uniref:Fur family transcriptional regulator n=1 Tax=Virgibacillus sp. W0430 TaxID=3391580 RepID=UPI003F471C53